MKVRKLIPNRTPDDAERLDKSCQRLAPTQCVAGGRLRALAVELPDEMSGEVATVAYED